MGQAGPTWLVPIPVGIHDFIPTEPAEGASAIEVLQGRPEVLALPVVDEAADKGLFEPSGDKLVRAGAPCPRLDVHPAMECIRNVGYTTCSRK